MHLRCRPLSNRKVARMAVEGPWNSPDKRAPEPTLEQLRNELCLYAQEIATLRNDLTAAQVENDNAKHDIERLMAACSAEASEVERLRHQVSRLNMRCEAMGWMLYPHSDPPREAVAGDIGWPGTTTQTAYERLQDALFRHACYCGCGDPTPDLHRPDCVYRQAHG